MYLATLLIFVAFAIVLTHGHADQFHYITINKTIHTKPLVNNSLPVMTKEMVAWVIYKNEVNKTGWARLELRSNPLFIDTYQALLSGYLEGFVTGDLIGMSWRSLQGNYCADKKYCKKLKKFLKTNRDYIDHQIKKLGPVDPFWHQVRLVYLQVEGLQKGYDAWEKKTGYKQPKGVDPVDLLILNLNSEMEELEEIIEGPTNKRIKMKCSALIKALPDGSELFVGHNTWDGYKGMLRVMKKHTLNFRKLGKDSKMSERNFTIAGHSSSFSSSPGLTHSADDFYVLSSGLAVQETTNENFNPQLYKLVRPDEIVFEFVRNVVANRLATSGAEWTQLFAQHNSGTYNNQFMVVDYKKFRPGTKPNDLPDDLLWVTEQMPGHMRSADVTDVLRKTSYWASYNVPYFKYIFNISKNNEMEKNEGKHYSYDWTSRARIFRRDQANVTSLKGMFKLLRLNDYKQDSLSRCELYTINATECDPPGNAALTIASRNDLNPENGSYPIEEIGFSLSGAVDAKVTSSAMAVKLQMLAVNGPTNDQQPPFEWTKVNDTENSHEGQPEKFDFKPYFVKWAPEVWSEASLN